MSRAAFLALLALAGCTSHAPRPEESYDRCVAAIHRGELVEARRRTTLALATWADPRTEWHWRFKLLDAEAALAVGQGAEVQKLLAAPVPPVPHQANLEARRRMHLANAALKLEDYAASARLLDEASSLAPPSDGPLHLEIDVLRGSLLTGTTGGPAADAVLHRSYARALELNDLYNQTVILNNLGYTRIKRFRYDEAIPYLNRALQAAEQCGAARFLSSILGNLAVCQSNLGDLDNALALRRRAVEIQIRSNARRNLQASYGEIGRILLLQGQARQAVPYLRDALAIARELNAPSFEFLWAAHLASAYIELQDWDAAERINAEVRNVGPWRDMAGIEAQARLNQAEIATGRQQYPAARRIYHQVLASVRDEPAVRWQAHAALGGLYTRTGNRRQAAAHFEAALRVIETTRAGLLQSDYKITFQNALIQFYRRYVDVLVDQGQIEKALRVAESSRARMLAEKLGLDHARLDASSTDYRALARASGAVLVSYWLAPDRSLLWVVAADRLRLFRLPGETQIRPLVEAWNRVLADLRDPLENPYPAGQRLSEILLGPIAPIVRPGSRVLLVPDGVLHRLNLETLPVPAAEKGVRPPCPPCTPPADSGTLRRGQGGLTPFSAAGRPRGQDGLTSFSKPPAGDHYWLDDVTVAVAPALGILTQPRPSRPARDSVLLIGNPDYRSPDFPNLPHAAEELDSVQRALPAAAFTVFTGPRAQPAAFRSSDPGRFSIIHFAAHAVANADSPLDSAIVLAPGADDSFKLYARDVLACPLQARLVTLSACRSAGARSYSGEGLVGLAWAFLEAGADHVIGGLWDVGDRSTAELMRLLYSNFASGQGPPEALRAAKLALAHSHAAYRKPFYWGPFLLYTRVRPWQGAPPH